MQGEATVVRAALDAIDQSRGCVEANRRLLSETRYRIASSRRRLNRAFTISGASSEDLLRHSLRYRLAAGELARIHQRQSWAGRAEIEASCAVCRRPIEPGAPEYEVRDDASSVLHAHAACYFMWRLESFAMASRNELSR